jgi:hypothetical protein
MGVSYLRTQKVGLHGIDIFNCIFIIDEPHFPVKLYILVNNHTSKTWINENPQNLRCDVLSHVAE